jgi:hypothetical protein
MYYWNQRQILQVKWLKRLFQFSHYEYSILYTNVCSAIPAASAFRAYLSVGKILYSLWILSIYT